MRTLLLGLGAISALIAAPTAAQTFSRGSAGTSVHSSFGNGGGSHWRDRHDRRSRRSAETITVMEWDGGEWAAYNNRSWESDSYNDWWHDRPDRAFPRWVQNNKDCQRVWWGGGGWRC